MNFHVDFDMIFESDSRANSDDSLPLPLPFPSSPPVPSTIRPGPAN